MITWLHDKLSLRFGKYESGFISLQLFDLDNHPYMTASFNPYDVNRKHDPNGQNLIAIKNWSENEGIEDKLLDAKIIKSENLINTIKQGFVSARIYKIESEVIHDN
tara:strand:- start:335 stop:652 length:318 start_codon:yes stop_codon:yes gene_type:complete